MLRIGTSGWIYREWRGPFYPGDLVQRAWLDFYGSQFDSVEVNGSFYRLPTQATVASWREATPGGFVFAWKMSRFITHMKRLRDVEASIARVYAPMLALGDKLGPALAQLPPQLGLDIPRLRDFLQLLPRERRHVVEFRRPDWYVDAVFEALANHGVALCISDHHHAPAPWIATAPFVYVRGHGPGGRYRDAYPQATLEAWADQIATWRDEGRPVFAYFDNDIGCAAPHDARRLKDLVRERCSEASEGKAEEQP